MTDTRPQFDRKLHGSLYDRGSADSYYRRAAYPHWYQGGTYNGLRITNLDDAERDEYNAGYSDNDFGGDFKEW